jgi:C4-dicarboxylate transporter DctQ subunit
VEDATETLACLALWGIVAVLFLQMFFRYVVKTGLSWPDELARYLHIVVVFVTVGAVARRGGHIRVTLLAGRLQGTAIQRLLPLAELLTAAVIALGAAEIIGRLGGFRTPALALPLALFFLPAAIGFALMTIEIARRWIAPGGRPPGAGADEGL